VVDNSAVPRLDRDFTVQRPRWEVSRLKSEIKTLTDAIRYKNTKLMKQKRLWKLGIDYGEWPTMGEVLHNLNEIESGIIYKGRMFEDELQKQIRRRKK